MKATRKYSLELTFDIFVVPILTRNTIWAEAYCFAWLLLLHLIGTPLFE